MWTTTDNGQHDPRCSRCLREGAERRRAAIAALRGFGDAIAYALAARAALLGLGIAEEDHDRVATAHFALMRLAEVGR